MAGGLQVQVRQIASYPAATIGPNDLLLVQQAGLGGPYVAANLEALLAPLNQGAFALGVGMTPPAGAVGNQVLADTLAMSNTGSLAWNAYRAAPGWHYQSSGPAAWLQFQLPQGFEWSVAPAGQAGAAISAWTVPLRLDLAGNLALSQGTLSVARDPGSAMEVATMGWVGGHTVASFNGRSGFVTLSAADISAALGFPADCLATIPQVNEIVCQAIQDLIRTYPAVWSWNGRVGDVWLTLEDINWVLASAGAPIIVPTPPSDANDGEAVNAGWVVNYVTSLLAGPPAYATETWVLEQLAAVNVGVMSWNGRTGTVTLTLADVTQVGGAPQADPTFSGYVSVPTAPPGTSDAQAASTAFVQAAVQAATAGVASFNGRTGAVTLLTADVTGAGGAPIASPTFTGTPAGPTAAAGTSTTQLATTQFVAAAIAGLGGVTSFNGRSGVVTLTAGDLTGAGGALLASPAFTGTPTAPTPAPGDNDTSIATTAFVTAAISTAISGIEAGVTSWNGRTGVVTLNTNDISAAGGLTNPSPGLTGTPTTPTAAPGTNTTQIASTAFVQAAIAGLGGVTSFNTRTGAVSLVLADVTGVGGAPLASPGLTGTPTAPTATAGTSTTQLATTAFVQNAIAGVVSGVSSFNTRTGAVTLQAADITGAGGALLASPALTGTPTAPTAAVGTSTTQIASTAFVQAAIAAGGVTSFNGRSGAVTLTLNDVTSVGGAPLASPNFSGTPTAPTPAVGNNSTSVATTAFVQQALAGLAPTVVAASAPASPGQGQLWWNTTDGQGYVWTGQQWVVFVNPPLGSYLPLAGGTMQGALTLAAGSTANRNFSIQGVIDGSNAPAGVVGEVIIGTGFNGGTANNTNVTLGTITLTAGDWDIVTWCYASSGGGGAVITRIAFVGALGAIGSNPNLINDTVFGSFYLGFPSTTPMIGWGGVVESGRLSLAASQTFNMVINTTQTSGTPRCECKCTARRVR